jgi:hypothetical protein
MCVKLEMAATKPKSRSMGTCWATRRRSSPVPTYHYRPPGNGRGVLTRESDVDFEMRSPNCEFPQVSQPVSVAVVGPGPSEAEIRWRT